MQVVRKALNLSRFVISNLEPYTLSPQKFPSWRISATMLATMADLANYQLEKSAANVLA
jgi:hypothetical protein